MTGYVGELFKFFQQLDVFCYVHEGAEEDVFAGNWVFFEGDIDWDPYDGAIGLDVFFVPSFGLDLTFCKLFQDVFVCFEVIGVCDIPVIDFPTISSSLILSKSQKAWFTVIHVPPKLQIAIGEEESLKKAS